MSSFSDRDITWTGQFLGWKDTKQSGKAQTTVKCKEKVEIGRGKQAMEAETRSKPVSTAPLLKFASSQPENGREKKHDGLWL